jgi:hypothetical protein
MARFIGVIVLVAISIPFNGALAQPPPGNDTPRLLSQTPVKLPPGDSAQTDNPPPPCYVRRMNDGVGIVADEAAGGFAQPYPDVAVFPPIVGSIAYTLVAQSDNSLAQLGGDIAPALVPYRYASCAVIVIPLNGIRITELWVSMFEVSAFEQGQAEPSTGHCTHWDSYSGWFKCEDVGSAAFTAVHTSQFLVVTLKNWSDDRTRGALVTVFGY